MTRKRKSVSWRERDVNGAPTDELWLAIPASLLKSAAWRGASISLRRLIDFLHVEHLRHERKENGRLIATYQQLVADAEIGRRLIAKAISEGQARGLVDVTPGKGGKGTQIPSRFRLTYFATKEADGWKAPTHEWKNYKPRKSSKPPVHEGEPGKSISPVHLRERAPIHLRELGASAKPRKSAKSPVHLREPEPGSPSCTTIKDSRRGCSGTGTDTGAACPAGEGAPVNGTVQSELPLMNHSDPDDKLGRLH